MSEDEFLDEPDSNDAASKRRRKTPRRSQTLVGVILIGIIIFFLPNLVLMSPLKHKVVSIATSDVDGKVQVESIRGGWLQSIRIQNLSITDSQNREVLRAKEVRLTKNILGLIFGEGFGDFEIDQPKADVYVRKQGTNMEDLFSKYLESDEPSDPIPPFNIKLNGGQLRLTNQLDGSVIEYGEVNADLRLFDDSGMAVSLTGNDLTHGGQLAVNGKINTGVNQLDFSQGELGVEIQHAGVGLATTILTRIGYDTSATGLANGKATIGWVGYGQTITTGFENFAVQNSILAAPDYIGQDRIMIGRGALQGGFEKAGNKMTAYKFQLQTDFAKMSANGTADLDAISNVLTTGQLRSSNFQLDGHADVASLAQMLPNTLGIHRDLRFQSGKLMFQSFCRTESEKQRILLNAELQNLVGVRGQQPFSIRDPVRIVAVATQTDQQTTIDDFKISSHFVNVTGSGTTRQAEFRANGDLSQLANELSQFVDLSNYRLGGRFEGNVQLVPIPSAEGGPPRMDWKAKIRVTNADISIPSWGRFRERQLDLVSNIRLWQNTDSSLGVEQSTFDLTAGSDRLNFQTSQAIKKLGFDSVWVGPLRMVGSVESWHARLKPLLGPSANFQSAGTIDLSASLAASPNRVAVQTSQLTIGNFQFRGWGMTIAEKQIAAACVGVLDFTKSNLAFESLTLRSSGFATGITNAEFQYGQNMRFQGQAVFQGDLNRIAGWVDSLRSNTMHYSGHVVGSASMLAQGGKYFGGIDANVTQAKVMKRAPTLNSTGQTKWDLVWHEPKITLGGKLSTSDFDTYEFGNLALQSKALALSSRGTLSDIGGTVQTNLVGNWKPDWKMISRIVHAYTGQNVAVTGNEIQAFTISGPVFVVDQVANRSNVKPAGSNGNAPTQSRFASRLSPKLKVQTEIRWDQANIAGFPLGKAQVPVNFENQVLSTSNLQFGVGRSGKASVQPYLNLQSGTPVLGLARNARVDQLELGPEVCKQWLKYIAPAVADAARAQGSLSVSTQQFEIPLSNPFAGAASGTVSIHQATVSSGPLADQLISLSKTIKNLTEGGNVVDSLLNGGGANLGAQNNPSTWVVMPKQDIAFRLHQQRIYHQGATFVIDGVPITTQGSVGVDQSVKLVASVPVQDKWIAGKAWLQGLKGKSIQVPIAGTLKQPRLDSNTMRSLSTQFLRQNVGSSLQNKLNQKLDGEIQKGLNKLFGK